MIANDTGVAITHSGNGLQHIKVAYPKKNMQITRPAIKGRFFVYNKVITAGDANPCRWFLFGNFTEVVKIKYKKVLTSLV